MERVNAEDDPLSSVKATAPKVSQRYRAAASEPTEALAKLDIAKTKVVVASKAAAKNSDTPRKDHLHGDDERLGLGLEANLAKTATLRPVDDDLAVGDGGGGMFTTAPETTEEAVPEVPRAAGFVGSSDITDELQVVSRLLEREKGGGDLFGASDVKRRVQAAPAVDDVGLDDDLLARLDRATLAPPVETSPVETPTPREPTTKGAPVVKPVSDDFDFAAYINQSSTSPGSGGGGLFD